jgi:hypothetical protein
MHATTTSQEGVVVVNGLRTFGKLHKREKGEKGEKRIHNSIIGNSLCICVCVFVCCFVLCFFLTLFYRGLRPLAYGIFS